MPDARKVGKKGRWSWIARIVVAAAAILWVFRGQDWRELAAVFRRLSPAWFAFSLAVFVVAQVVVGLRWWLLLRIQSVHIPPSAAVRLYFLGLFYNNVMPGAVGGDLLKAWYVTRHTHRKVAGVLSVFADRAIGLIVLLLMAVTTYATFVRGQIVSGQGSQQSDPASTLSSCQTTILWGLVVCAAVLTVFWIHPAGRARLRSLAARGWSKSVELAVEMRQVVVVYCSKPWQLLLVALMTVFSQVTVILAFWLLGRNLGMEAGLRYYLVVFPVMWVVAAVPVSIAGLGVFEAGMVEMFGFLAGTPAEQALALAFCQRFVWVLTSLPGGLIHLLGAHLPREDISVDCEGTGN
ncbi:MAG TPA: lysylphosphatidylglycerol synthase transmembrane domain-containing protein [Sedimentisphaerales bacterium]|nr:lysylphosphatidylglycerol synthase transmembrane domain-containing protein [Sedimentisphaerales bacterium]